MPPNTFLVFLLHLVWKKESKFWYFSVFLNYSC